MIVRQRVALDFFILLGINILLRGLLLHLFRVAVHGLVDDDVTLFEENAVRGHAVAALDRNDVANDKIRDLDSPGIAIAAEDLNFLVSDLCLQFKPLLVF